MRVIRGDTVKVNYEYLPDGTKVSALAGSGAGYKYRGSFVYAVDVLGNETLESVACDEGRITVTYDNMGTPSYRDDWHVKDHLGSVRVVMDITSTAQSPATSTLEKSDYLPFGTRVALSSNPSNRWRFGGKEEQNIGGEDFTLLDFGARHYDPWLTRWTSQDPLAGKYTSTSPYAYCAGDPVNLVDSKGDSLAVLIIDGQHLAMLIQNENGEWQYYSINGDNQRYPILGFKGGRYSDDLQVGSFSSVKEFLLSDYNTKGDTKEQKRGDKMIAGYDFIEGYVIPTSAEQDKDASKEFIRISTEEEYHLLFPSNHCSTTVERALLAAGIDVRRTDYIIDGSGRKTEIKRLHILPTHAYKAIKTAISGEVVRR